MAKMIQIRNVPDDLHRRLKVRAAQQGMTLSDYLLSEIERIADTPTIDELRLRIRRRKPLETDLDSATIIRELRGGP
jgi:plasmid stability protein